MRYVYPAIFTPDENAMRVRVPDLPGLFTFGDDIIEAMYMAKDAVEMWLWDAENSKEDMPKASSRADLESQLEVGEFINLVAADTEDYRRRNSKKAVKKTLSIPEWLNYEAEKANAPFSQILQEGLKSYLHIE